MIKLFHKIRHTILPTLLLVMIFSCVSQNSKEPLDLDMNAYLSFADKDTIYPTEKQLAMLKEVMPREAFQPAPKISNREYWKGIAETSSGKEYLTKALEL